MTTRGSGYGDSQRKSRRTRPVLLRIECLEARRVLSATILPLGTLPAAPAGAASPPVVGHHFSGNFAPPAFVNRPAISPAHSFAADSATAATNATVDGPSESAIINPSNSANTSPGSELSGGPLAADFTGPSAGQALQFPAGGRLHGRFELSTPADLPAPLPGESPTAPLATNSTLDGNANSSAAFAADGVAPFDRHNGLARSNDSTLLSTLDPSGSAEFDANASGGHMRLFFAPWTTGAAAGDLSLADALRAIRAARSAPTGADPSAQPLVQSDTTLADAPQAVVAVALPVMDTVDGAATDSSSDVVVAPVLPANLTSIMLNPSQVADSTPAAGNGSAAPAPTNAAAAPASSYSSTTATADEADSDGGFLSIDDVAAAAPRLGAHFGTTPEPGRVGSDDSSRANRAADENAGVPAQAGSAANVAAVFDASLAMSPESPRMMLQAADGGNEGGAIELAVDAPSMIAVGDDGQATDVTIAKIRPVSEVGMFCDVEVEVAHDGPIHGAISVDGPEVRPAMKPPAAAVGDTTIDAATPLPVAMHGGEPEASFDVAGTTPMFGLFVLALFANGLRVEEPSPARESRMRAIEDLRRGD